MLTSFFQLCQGEPDSVQHNVVQLCSDDIEPDFMQPVHMLTKQDSFDMTFSPQTSPRDDRPQNLLVTPRQRTLKERIRLPVMRRCLVPTTCKPEDSEEWRRQELLRIYQEFVINLHKGMHLTQLTSNEDYSDIHCQILEDLQTLSVDGGTGSIIEFPLGSVSKAYRTVKNNDTWYSAGSLTGPTPMLPLPLSNAEHIVVVEFRRRKIVFVFNEMRPAQDFLMCMELLILRAKEFQQDAQTWKPGIGNACDHGSDRPMSPSLSKPVLRQHLGDHAAPREPSETLEFGASFCLVGTVVCQADNANNDK